MSRSKLIGAGILALSLFILIVAFFMLPNRTSRYYSQAQSGQAVGVIYISGAIMAGGSASDLFGSVTAGSNTIMSQIKQAAEDPDIKAVLLRINSPGGSAAASQEIGEELQKLKKTGKTIVTSMGDSAASGGYWIAAHSDLIVANPGTLTGSIGVITQLQNLEGLYDMLGIEHETFVSGPHKDMGSTSRPPTGEERQIFQAMVDDIYEQFVDVVAQGRNMEREEVIALADGRIYTGRQAKELGLVDELGNFHTALDIAAQRAGLGENYRVKHFIRTSPLQRLLQSVSSIIPLELRQQQAKGLLSHGQVIIN